MKTLTAFVCTAALAAGIATSVAQSNVYSLNVVGYYNIPCAANQLVMIANQLNTTNNTLGGLIPNGPADAQVFKFNGGFTSYTYDDLDLNWEDGTTVTLNPGEGAFYKSPTATTLTFVGEVLQGALANTLPINTLVMRSSLVPQQGLISTDLGVPGEADDQAFVFNGGYTSYTFDDLDLKWEPEPVINVGQAFMYKKAPTSVSSSWVRNFTVQ